MLSIANLIITDLFSSFIITVFHGNRHFIFQDMKKVLLNRTICIAHHQQLLTSWTTMFVKIKKKMRSSKSGSRNEGVSLRGLLISCHLLGGLSCSRSEALVSTRSLPVLWGQVLMNCCASSPLPHRRSLLRRALARMNPQPPDTSSHTAQQHLLNMHTKHNRGQMQGDRRLKRTRDQLDHTGLVVVYIWFDPGRS